MLNTRNHLLPSTLVVLLAGQVSTLATPSLLLTYMLVVLLAGHVSAFATPSFLIATQVIYRSRRCSTHAVEVGLVGDVYGIVSNAPAPLTCPPHTLRPVGAEELEAQGQEGKEAIGSHLTRCDREQQRWAESEAIAEQRAAWHSMDSQVQTSPESTAQRNL